MPDKKPVNRKLSAILSADVKGYSVLMADDEVHTIETLKAYRQVISDLVLKHSGRVVDSPGDNILAEFRSSVDAVECAVKIQKRLEQENSKYVDEKKVQFRIGVNVGDVIQDGDRIYGNGVNVAARIEGLADPGGVCISRNAYDHISDKLNFGYEYLGEHSVKNIKKPVRVYKLLMADEDAGKLIGERPKPLVKNWIWATIVVAAVVITSVVILVYQNTSKPEFEPAKVEKMAFPLPDKPSIAVLPFDNMSGDPEQNYIADGFTENIITGLSQIPEMFVIARNSVFTYKGKPVKIREVSEEFGVKYVLEGSIQRTGNQLRVNAQLIDALEGHHLWAKRFDRDLKDLFKLQDEITLEILNTLHVKLVSGGDSLLWWQTDSFDAWGHNVKGWYFSDKSTKQDNLKAREHYKQALKLDPDNGAAWEQLAWTYIREVWLGSSDSPEKSIKQALEIYEKTSERWGKGGLHFFMSEIYLFQNQFEKAITEGKKAVAFNPNSSRYHIGLAGALNRGAKPEEAIFHAKKAMRLEPYYPVFYLDWVLGAAYGQAGRYQEALEVYDKVLQRALNGEYSVAKAHRRLAGIYAKLDRMEEARVHVAESLKLDPDFYVDRWRKKGRFLYKDQKYIDSSAEMLIRAGLPEHPPLPLPDKPSIAVLAFDNLSGDPEQEYFSDGLSEEIINALSKTDQLFVIARNSSFTYKSKPVNVKQISRELGVRYVLEGSVRKSGDRVRITAQLIDATTGHHLWSERYDRDLKDIFALQDEITLKIVTALEIKLTEGEQARMWGRHYKTLDVFLKRMEAHSLWREGTAESHMRHAQVSQEIIDMAPESPRGYMSLGYHYWWLALIGKSPRENIKKAFELAQTAISKDESDPASHELLASVYLSMRQYDKAIASGQRAIELDPNSADVYAKLGQTLSFAERPSEAIEYIKKGMRLNPFPEPFYYIDLGRCYTLKGEYEKALKEYKKAIQRRPKAPWPHMYLAIAYSLLDRQEEAHASAKKCLELAPFVSVGWITKISLFKNEADLELIIDAMRKAGFPEGA